MTLKGGSSKAATASLLAALVGLWPVYFLVILWALGRWGGEGGAFSLDPRDTSRNVQALLVGLGAALVLDALAIFLALRTLGRKAAGKGRAVAGLALGILGVLVLAALLAAGLMVRNQLGGKGKMTQQQEIDKCRGNQRTIATALGPEMWGYDHPDAKPEDLKKLDLSPKGDLSESDTGIAYINDATVLNCPADKDLNDVDYAVDVTPEGAIKVRCIDPKGIKDGHNP